METALDKASNIELAKMLLVAAQENEIRRQALFEEAKKRAIENIIERLSLVFRKFFDAESSRGYSRDGLCKELAAKAFDALGGVDSEHYRMLRDENARLREELRQALTLPNDPPPRPAPSAPLKKGG